MPKFTVSYDLLVAGLIEVDAADAGEAEDKVRDMRGTELLRLANTGDDDCVGIFEINDVIAAPEPFADTKAKLADALQSVKDSIKNA